MRALKGLVIGMGVLIVVGLTIVVVTIAMRLGGGEDGEPAAAPAERPAPARDAASFGRLSLGVADSCTIADAVDSAGRLIVRLSGPGKDGCDQLVVVDPARGQVLGRIAPGKAPADAGAGQGADSGGAE